MGRKKVCWNSSVLLAVGRAGTQLVTKADYVQVEVACRELDTPIVHSTSRPSLPAGLPLRHVKQHQLVLFAPKKLVEANVEDNCQISKDHTSLSNIRAGSQ